jgi:hypothetical protein
LLDISVNTLNKSGDDLLSIWVIEVHVLSQIDPRPQQSCPNIAVECLRALNLSQRAGHLATPDFELEETITGGVVALGEEQIVLVLGVDVRDTPTVGQDFDGFLQTGDFESGCSFLGVGVGGKRMS